MPSRHEKSVRIASSIQALVADRQSTVALILTHPWGALGGNMHNNVVAAVAFFFQKLGITTLRFDFGGSQIGRGYVQVEQVRTVARALLTGECLESKPPQYILLVGYSYGSLIAASASADIEPCIGVVNISPPFGVQHWLLWFHQSYHFQQAIKRNDIKRLFVIGSNDNFTTESVFQSKVESFPASNTTGAVIKDADHFWQGRERDLMDVIAQWLLTTYPNYALNELRNLKLDGET